MYRRHEMGYLGRTFSLESLLLKSVKTSFNARKKTRHFGWYRVGLNVLTENHLAMYGASCMYVAMYCRPMQRYICASIQCMFNTGPYSPMPIVWQVNMRRINDHWKRISALNRWLYNYKWAQIEEFQLIVISSVDEVYQLICKYTSATFIVYKLQTNQQKWHNNNYEYGSKLYGVLFIQN